MQVRKQTLHCGRSSLATICDAESCQCLSTLECMNVGFVQETDGLKTLFSDIDVKPFACPVSLRGKVTKELFCFLSFLCFL